MTLRQKLGYCILMKHLHNYKESINKEDSEMVDISMDIDIKWYDFIKLVAGCDPVELLRLRFNECDIYVADPQ